MLEFGACPQCKLDIAPERKKAVPMICNHCGFTSTNDEIVQAQIEKKTIISFVVVSVFVLAAHILLSHWDKHALGIIPIFVKESIGAVSQADLEAKAEICLDLKYWDCLEDVYVKTAKNDPKLWQRAGDFFMKRGKYAEAARAYYPLFQLGAQDLDVSYRYAQALAKTGQVDEAVGYFEGILAARPEMLQVTVVQNYVKLLMENQRYDQAKVLINKIRKQSGVTGEMFMEEELKKIQELTTASRD